MANLARLTDNRKEEILESLRQEREQRRQILSKGELFEPDDPYSTADYRSNPSLHRPCDTSLDQAKQSLKEILQEERCARYSLNPTTAPSSSSKPKKRDFDFPQKEAKFNFKPTINPQQKHEYKQKSDWDSFEQRLIELSRPKTELIKRWEAEKTEKESADFQNHCTFRPAISNHCFESSPFEEPVEDRLIRLGEQKQQMTEKLMLEKEMREIAKHSFHPDITVVSDNPPIHTRIGELQKQKNDALERLRIAHEIHAGLTFKPNISPHSEELAEKRRLNPRVKKKAEPEEFTFSPNNYNGEDYDFKEFIARQDAFVHYKEANIQKRIDNTKEQFSFKPFIGIDFFDLGPLYFWKIFNFPVFNFFVFVVIITFTLSS